MKVTIDLYHDAHHDPHEAAHTEVDLLLHAELGPD